MSIKDSHFGYLPDEVLCMILSEVNTVDLCNFCNAFQDCDHFFQEKSVIKSLILARCYILENLKPIMQRLAHELVTTLNINFVYWIPAHDLRKFVQKLINLQNLYAIDTNLGFTKADMWLYSNNTNLRKLAVTFKESSIDRTILAPSLQTLYVNVITASISVHVLSDIICRVFPGLKEIWVDMATDKPVHCTYYPVPSLALKVFYRIDYAVPAQNYEYAGLITYYSGRRNSQPYIICAEKLNLDDLRKGSPRTIVDYVSATHVAYKEWSFLEDFGFRFGCNTPYGPKDAKKLALWKNGFIKFEEFNFNHGNMDCILNESYLKAVRVILATSDAERLKKLCINTCLLINEDCEQDLKATNNAQEDASFEFKRKRVGIGNIDCAHMAQNFFKNYECLEVLELLDCSNPHLIFTRVVASSMYVNFSNIGTLDKLKSLTVEVPIFMDGKFLANVLANCKSLEILKVKSARHNEKLNANLCLALQKPHSLKDLRYEIPHMPIDKLMNSLCKVGNNSLERVAFICESIDIFTAQIFKDFLESNPQLVFLYFSINEATDAFRKKVRATLNEYKRGNRVKIFHIEHKNVVFKKGFPIPDFHYREMINCKSQVSMMDVSEDFPSF